jgi:hypothetical protein
MAAEHDRADLAAADAAGTIQRHGQRLARVWQRRMCGSSGASVEVNGVAADGHDTGTPER